MAEPSELSDSNSGLAARCSYVLGRRDLVHTTVVVVVMVTMMMLVMFGDGD